MELVGMVGGPTKPPRRCIGVCGPARPLETTNLLLAAPNIAASFFARRTVSLRASDERDGQQLLVTSERAFTKCGEQRSATISM